MMSFREFLELNEGSLVYKMVPGLDHIRTAVLNVRGVYKKAIMYFQTLIDAGESTQRAIHISSTNFKISDKEFTEVLLKHKIIT